MTNRKQWDNAAILFVLAVWLPTLSASADLPGRPPGAPPPPTAFLPGEDVDDASGAPLVQGPLEPVGDVTKPGVPNVVFYDFGTVSNARIEPIRHAFRIRNRSNMPVSIERVASGCTCTTASIEWTQATAGHRVEPGQTFVVDVSLNPEQLYVGTINKIVWIYLSGQGSPAFTMHMKGRTRAMATFSPSLLDLGRVRAGNARLMKVTITADIGVYGPHPPDPYSVKGSVTIARDRSPAIVRGGQLVRRYDLSVSHRVRPGLLSDLIAMPLSHGRRGDAGASIVVTGVVLPHATHTRRGATKAAHAAVSC